MIPPRYDHSRNADALLEPMVAAIEPVSDGGDHVGGAAPEDTELDLSQRAQHEADGVGGVAQVEAASEHVEQVEGPKVVLRVSKGLAEVDCEVEHLRSKGDDQEQREEDGEHCARALRMEARGRARLVELARLIELAEDNAAKAREA